jgi:hypothetical protein
VQVTASREIVVDYLYLQILRHDRLQRATASGSLQRAM